MAEATMAINLRVSQEQYDWLQAEKQRTGQSVNNLIRKMIDVWRQEAEKE